MSERTTGQLFTAGDESSGLLLTWWKELDHDRGERAHLRRAARPADVVLCPSFHRLLGQLRQAGYPIGAGGADQIATVAGLSAHVRIHDGKLSVAQQLAKPKSAGTGARVSGLRFRRLLAVSDRHQMYPLLVRAVRLLDGSVNLVSLANAAYWWNERTKKSWAYDYYATAPSEL
jgi:CRISPR system Cascade subunit CasB